MQRSETTSPLSLSFVWGGPCELKGGSIGSVEVLINGVLRYCSVSPERNDQVLFFSRVKTGSDDVFDIEFLKIKKIETARSISLRIRFYVEMDAGISAFGYGGAPVHDIYFTQQSVNVQLDNTQIRPGRHYQILLSPRAGLANLADLIAHHDGFHAKLREVAAPQNFVNDTEADSKQLLANVFREMLSQVLLEKITKLKRAPMNFFDGSLFAVDREGVAAHQKMIDESFLQLVENIDELLCEKLQAQILDHARFMKIYLNAGGDIDLYHLASHVLQTTHPQADPAIVKNTANEFVREAAELYEKSVINLLKSKMNKMFK